MPIETIELLATYNRAARFIRGNADRLMVEIFDGTREAAGDDPDAWPARQLSRAHRDFLSRFEPLVEVDVEGLGRVLCCHASPTSDEVPIITPATPNEVIVEALASAEAKVVIAGHTHIQFDRRVTGHRMVNAGSVGMPYADRPGAYWALVGPEIGLRRSIYDFPAAAEAVRGTSFPEGKDLANHILRPPSAQEAIRVFERRASRAYPA